MPEIVVRAVVITTGVDRQGHVFTPAVLYQLADQANEGAATRMTFDHNRTLPPAGKGLSATVERGEDGGLRLVSETVVFDTPKLVTLPNGAEALMQGTDRDTRPFAEPDLHTPSTFAVYSDIANFGSDSEWDEFNAEIERGAGFEIERKLIARKAFISPPELVILVGSLLPVGLAIKAFVKRVASNENDRSFLKQLSEKTGNKLSETIAEDVDKFYRVVRSAAWAGAKRFLPANRATTYVIQVPPAFPDTPVIAFVVTTNDPTVLEQATRWDRIEAALFDAEELTERFGAKEIQYLLDDGDWRFNYLLTSDGKVVGCKPGFLQRARVIKMLRRAKEEGVVPQAEDLAHLVDVYDAEEEFADLRFLSENGQAVSFGGTVAHYTPVLQPGQQAETTLEQEITLGDPA